MMVKVKICGIRSLNAAQTAVGSGADFIGLNFVPTSKRKVSMETAKKIIEKFKGAINIVGVFQNQSLNEVNKIADFLELDYIQLHGEEDQDYINKIYNPAIKVFKLKSDFIVEDVLKKMNKLDIKYFLIDREKQGEGDMLNLDRLNTLSLNFPIFVAGGLNPNNVEEIVKKTQPFAVDVASGIETEGVEDLEKIKLFIERAKNV